MIYEGEKLNGRNCASAESAETSRILREFVIVRALSFGYIQKMVVLRGCVRSVANEQHREKRLVIITRGRFAIGLNPFWMLRPERIMHLALKLGVTRNFSDAD